MSHGDHHRMSFYGFKKSFKKSNQFLGEKIGLAKQTQLDKRFIVLEKKIDVFAKLVDESREKTHEILQPNPVLRTKLLTVNNWQKISGTDRVVQYPQSEGALGEIMLKYSNELGQESNFAHALYDLGESLRTVGEHKHLLEESVKQNFIDPLSKLKHNDLKNIMNGRKLNESLRLDYDAQKNRKKRTTQHEIETKLAGERFEDSKILVEADMIHFLQNEKDQIMLLQNYAESMMEYHKKCEETMKITLQDLRERQRNLNGGMPDFLSAKTRKIKHQIADMVKPDKLEAAEL